MQSFRGKSSLVKDIYMEAEHGDGKPVSGVSHLANPFESLPDIYSGKLLIDSVLLEKKDNIHEKIYMFTFNDSLHSNVGLLKTAKDRLIKQENSIVDEETGFMRKMIEKCGFPAEVDDAERALLEQSVSIMMMSQVSEKEIFPRGRGQVLASLRPGIWHVSWVRDGSFVIQGMTRIGMYEQAKKALEFMLQAEAGRFKHYRHTDGKDYGPGIDYRISLTRYFGNGVEEM
jgi:GH15 family glucan-1,4-alpha-glucosidase